MNDLSWLLFWADALPGIAQALAITCGLLTVFLIFLYILGVTQGFGSWTRESDQHLAKSNREFGRWWVLTFSIWMLTFIVPSTNTFYAIAASEMGEEFTKTKTFNKASAALDAWLDKQIEKPKEGVE